VLTRWLVSGLAIAIIVGTPPVGAQRQRPLSPVPTQGLGVAPFFDGWYANSDGTTTFSFGYSNMNEDLVEIPLGSDNFIVPKEYDGRQPTAFVPVVSDSPTGAARRGRDRERGVFTVTVPAGFRGDVVWTLRHGGQTLRVPARTKSGAYRLQWPMAMGSVPPLLRFAPEGTAGRGPVGIQADAVNTSVGAPLSLTVLVTDDSVREQDPVSIKPRVARPAINVTWYKHSGPGSVVIDPPKNSIAEVEGTATTSLTFAQPGEYVVRVRADNFGRLDTSAGNQCCWTNGYVKVTVTP
jgi:hypothetical protein